MKNKKVKTWHFVQRIQTLNLIEKCSHQSYFFILDSLEFFFAVTLLSHYAFFSMSYMLHVEEMFAVAETFSHTHHRYSSNYLKNTKMVQLMLHSQIGCDEIVCIKFQNHETECSRTIFAYAKFLFDGQALCDGKMPITITNLLLQCLENLMVLSLN